MHRGKKFRQVLKKVLGGRERKENQKTKEVTGVNPLRTRVTHLWSLDEEINSAGKRDFPSRSPVIGRDYFVKRSLWVCTLPPENNLA